MTENEVKATIRCIHQAWYADWLGDAETALKMHRHMEVLFNYAGIESSLVENNPNEVSPREFAAMTGVVEPRTEERSDKRDRAKRQK